jgi:hypothetical protein
MIFVICQQKCEINRIFLNVILNILLISLTFFCTFSNNIIVRFDPFSSFPDAFFICSLIIIIIFIDVPPRQILIHPRRRFHPLSERTVSGVNSRERDGGGRRKCGLITATWLNYNAHCFYTVKRKES